MRGLSTPQIGPILWGLPEHFHSTEVPFETSVARGVHARNRNRTNAERRAQSAVLMFNRRVGREALGTVEGGAILGCAAVLEGWILVADRLGWRRGIRYRGIRRRRLGRVGRRARRISRRTARICRFGCVCGLWQPLGVFRTLRACCRSWLLLNGEAAQERWRSQGDPGDICRHTEKGQVSGAQHAGHSVLRIYWYEVPRDKAAPPRRGRQSFPNDVGQHSSQ